MTLLINLDEQEVEIEGILFGIKPATEGVFDLMTQMSGAQGLKKDSQDIDVGLKLLSNKKYQKTLSDLILKHCTMVKPFQVQQGGETRDGTMEELLSFENTDFVKIKAELLNNIISFSSLSKEEAETVKK